MRLQRILRYLGSECRPIVPILIPGLKQNLDLAQHFSLIERQFLFPFVPW